MTSRNLPEPAYETMIEEAIATCGGDMRGALKALLLANEHLEAELSYLRAITASHDRTLDGAYLN